MFRLCARYDSTCILTNHHPPTPPHQVLFLLYHYYEAREAYNAIRVFIASYVWMTGYGNFAYYHKSRDFSAGRFAQMMWRLNLLAVICCAALGCVELIFCI